jgi:hypothetical protein
MTSAQATAAAQVVRAARPALRRDLGALCFVLAIGILAASHGGYFPTSWGWSALVLFWLAAMALLIRRQIAVSRAEVALLLAMTAFVAWIALSIVWSSARVDSIQELERALVYLAGVLALLVVVHERSVSSLLAGLLAAATLVAAYALATRLLPDRVGTFDSISVYRLSEPVGYWNALGVFAAMAALLALGFAARARHVAGRAAAAAALPVLLLTLYFTFGRGAWIAFGLGLAVVVALDSRRLQLLVTILALALPSALVVWLGSRSEALTTLRSSLDRAAHDGHRLALMLVGAAALSALLAACLALAETRASPGRGWRTAFVALLSAATLAALAVVFAEYGGPPTLARKAYDSFTAQPVTGPKLSGRLFSLSSNGRIDMWRAAGRDFESRPLLGSGAGSFEEYWRLHRPSEQDVRDAHSLYMETLAELGIVGLVLLVLTLGIPLLAIRHRRAHRFVPFALGAYAAFLLHAGADWDWEMPAITLTALACGTAALIAVRGTTGRLTSLSAPLRYACFALVVVIGAFSLVTFVGNRDASASTSAAEGQSWQQAARDARSAERWLPWSSEPWQLLGDAKFGEGDFRGAANAYRKAIELDPRNWILWFDLGFSTNGTESSMAFARAAALDPKNSQIPRPTGEAPPAS